MAAVLFVAGTLICAVSMLSPERLTPLALNVANKVLDADVKASRVELGLKATFPFLTLQVDSLSIVSRGMRSLAPDMRVSLPAYADTLLCLQSLRGGISLTSLAKGDIDLSDITVCPWAQYSHRCRRHMQLSHNAAGQHAAGQRSAKAAFHIAHTHGNPCSAPGAVF